MIMTRAAISLLSRSIVLAGSTLLAVGVAYAATDPSVVSAAKDFVANALHPLSYFGVFLGLLFSGPGKWSLQKS